jgi:predicted dehydrogenase
MIRLGLIGCGEHSEGQHAIPLARYKKAHPDEIELTAACDLRRERAELFCRQYGFLQAFTQIDEMLMKHTFDGLISVVPVERIPEVGIKLLKLGIPCVIEKPLGPSLDEVRALLEAARATRTANMVSVNRRFMPFLNRAIGWAQEQGSLRYVRCTMSRHARTEPDFLWATAVHAVDTLRYIAGNVVGHQIRALERTVEDVDWYAIDLQFKSGVCGRVDVLPTAGVLEETYELMGEGFRVIVTCPFGLQRGWRAFQANRMVMEETSNTVAEDVLNGSYGEAAAFIRAVSQREFPSPSIEDVFPSVRLCWEMVTKVKHNAGQLVPAKS